MNGKQVEDLQEDEPKEVILGFPGAGAGNIASMLGGLNDRSRKAVSDNLSSRRNKLELLIPYFVEKDFLKTYAKMTSKELKKKSSEFHLIYRYVESLNLQLYSKGNALPNEVGLKKIAKLINSLTNTSQFAKMDFEDVSTDFFEITFATFIALKNISVGISRRNLNIGVTHAITMVASDLGLRLYDMYIDNRKDDVNEPETVQFR